MRYSARITIAIILHCFRCYDDIVCIKRAYCFSIQFFLLSFFLILFAILDLDFIRICFIFFLFVIARQNAVARKADSLIIIISYDAGLVNAIKSH